MGKADGIAFEFACYIASRSPRGTPWTRIYDEMCRVARSRAFRGMGYAELSDVGVSLSITGLDYICQLLDEAWGRSETPADGAPACGDPVATQRSHRVAPYEDPPVRSLVADDTLCAEMEIRDRVIDVV